MAVALARVGNRVYRLRGLQRPVYTDKGLYVTSDSDKPLLHALRAQRQWSKKVARNSRYHPWQYVKRRRFF